jgi:hypothetical protein
MKTEFKELLDTPLKRGGFTLASQTLSIGRKAEGIAKLANDKQIENGEFATLFASNIKEWMQEIADMAQETLDLQMKRDARDE